MNELCGRFKSANAAIGSFSVDVGRVRSVKTDSKRTMCTVNRENKPGREAVRHLQRAANVATDVSVLLRITERKTPSNAKRLLPLFAVTRFSGKDSGGFD